MDEVGGLVAREVLTEREAAQLLRVSVRTLFDLRKRQGLPFVSLGRSVRYVRAQVMEWLQRRANARAGGALP